MKDTNISLAYTYSFTRVHTYTQKSDFFVFISTEELVELICTCVLVCVAHFGACVPLANEAFFQLDFLPSDKIERALTHNRLYTNISLAMSAAAAFIITCFFLSFFIFLFGLSSKGIVKLVLRQNKQ